MATILLIDADPDGSLAAELEALAPCLVHHVVSRDGSVPMICAGINALDPVAPLLIVTAIPDASILPGIALAQRAAHRRIEGYVLIAPIRVTTGDTWPEAPVFVTTSTDVPDSVGAGLRGWTVIAAESTRDQAAAIITAASSVG